MLRDNPAASQAWRQSGKKGMRSPWYYSGRSLNIAFDPMALPEGLLTPLTRLEIAPKLSKLLTLRVPVEKFWKMPTQMVESLILNSFFQTDMRHPTV